MRTSSAVLLCVLGALIGASRAAAQSADGGVGADSGCDYRTCALGISPRWNGLAVVRGAEGRPVANLGFFLPRDVASVLRGRDVGAPGADSAAAQARRALRLRWSGAVLTDAGIATVAVAVLRAARRGKGTRTDTMLAAGGGAALAVSVPLQFAADGALSRAIWWHNRRFAR